MAVIIDVKKISEDPDEALFEFHSGNRTGSFRFRKKEAACVPAEDLSDDLRALYARAAHKITQAWQSENKLPDQISWAS